MRSRGLGGNIMAGLRSIVGGEIHEYTQLLEEARRHAIDRLVENAAAMGANAVLMMRFELGRDRPDDERDRRLRHGGRRRARCPGEHQRACAPPSWASGSRCWLAARRAAASPAASPWARRLAVSGLVLIAAALVERWRYKRLGGAHPGSDWIATAERFVDPESGKLVTVYYRPATGERRYVAG